MHTALSIWKHIYNKFNLDFDIETKIKDDLFLVNIQSKPQITPYGIKFKNFEEATNALNTYTISIISYLFTKQIIDKKIFIACNKDFDLLNYSINSIFNNRIFVAKNTIDPFLFQNEIKNNYDYAIYFEFNEFDQFWYVKLFDQNKLISINQMTNLVETMIHFDEIINFTNDQSNVNYVSIDQIYNSIEFDQYHQATQINSYSYASDLNSMTNIDFILKKITNHLQLQQKKSNKSFFSNKFFFKYIRYLKYKKSDVFILYNQKKNFKFAFKIKSKLWYKIPSYNEIKSDELLYLLINFYSFSWKNKNFDQKDQIIIKPNQINEITNLLSSLGFNWTYVDSIDKNNLINIIDNPIDYSNYNLVFQVCKMLDTYKKNNNLLYLKYKKMKNFFKSNIIKHFTINCSYMDLNKLTNDNLKQIIDNFNLKHKWKIDWNNSKIVNFQDQTTHYLVNLEMKNNNNNNKKINFYVYKHLANEWITIKANYNDKNIKNKLNRFFAFWNLIFKTKKIKKIIKKCL
ncbi:hypothetical protein GE118_02995 [Mycoplasma sp. NEAQ87857]|uniref:hypothetical protein n=1 Tax=Mycoplasma sp. NEAQ87857 TaxID=2683967 RepID=UPI0013187FEA|nr:hypothetical protein [Mycoplasma sp. NEAQ87857]QGZ97756.1 hypothetical protein GE118_02995 [Mycoplasma sp. NEAQ87857]